MKKTIIIFVIGFFMFGNVYGEKNIGSNNSKDVLNTKHHRMNMEEKYRVDEDLGICPVMGGTASEEYYYTYKNKTYNFCCPMCIDKFKENPEKYINKIKEIDMEAFQFGFEPENIVVSQGDIVKITISSRDVIHGFYIKEYGINVSVSKGEPKKIEFIADKVGVFPVLCSVYCGRGHSGMKAELIVKSKTRE